MFKAEDLEQKQDERQAQARLRGEGLRAEIRARLESDGAQSAADLLPHMSMDVSLAEVAFQLGRLSEEGAALGETGGPYTLT